MVILENVTAVAIPENVTATVRAMVIVMAVVETAKSGCGEDENQSS